LRSRSRGRDRHGIRNSYLCNKKKYSASRNSVHIKMGRVSVAAINE